MGSKWKLDRNQDKIQIGLNREELGMETGWKERTEQNRDTFKRGLVGYRDTSGSAMETELGWNQDDIGSGLGLVTEQEL